MMDVEAMSAAEILSIATPIMDNLMEASTRSDHEAHVRAVTDRMKKIGAPDYLQRVCEQYQQEKEFFLLSEIL